MEWMSQWKKTLEVFPCVCMEQTTDERPIISEINKIVISNTNFPVLISTLIGPLPTTTELGAGPGGRHYELQLA
jgi:hypothetical protein